MAKALANVRELAGLTGEAKDLSEVILNRQNLRDSAATVPGQLIRELREQRDKLAAVKERQNELEQEADQSQTLKQKKQQLTQRREELEAYRQENRQAVRREMEQVVLRLKRRYLDLAGEGQAGRASLMRTVALHDTR